MRQRFSLSALILFAFLLRFWSLGGKAFSYDEAATALMARATPWEIILFHWQAAFEHPPVWQLLMHSWSLAAGQSEFALRFMPALAGVLHVPLVWWFARRLVALDRPQRPRAEAIPLLAALLAAVAPVLVMYSQEARMYTLVVLCALASLLLLLRMSTQAQGITLWRMAAFVAINWLMLGLHYYSALLLVAQGGYLLWNLAQPFAEDGRRGRTFLLLAAGLALSALPLLGWMALAPGFRATAEVILAGVGGAQKAWWRFLDELWRDLTFGAFRWMPAWAWMGYLLLPFAAAGAVQSIRHAVAGSRADRLLLLTILLPILLSALLFRNLAARYILFVAPLLAIWSAAAIARLWSIRRWLGWLGLAMALAASGAGLYFHYAHFTKSEYREMATYLQQAAQPGDGFLLEAPRQHLLAKYYLPADWEFYTAPTVTLPEFWPINAPPVVPEEMDDLLQAYLREHGTLWLILTSEDEVDKGEFVPKYLTAVSYRVDCRAWLDVRLCRFVSPWSVAPELSREWNSRFGDELVLERTTLAVEPPLPGAPEAASTLLLTLEWFAERQPSIDYRVTVRLLDAAGNVVGQHDAFPIGDLLPPTTWQAGERKPGYVALPVPPGAGTLRVVVGVYDPGTGLEVGEWLEVGEVGE